MEPMPGFKSMNIGGKYNGSGKVKDHCGYRRHEGPRPTKAIVDAMKSGQGPGKVKTQEQAGA
jgi:hypothetical protein